MSNYNADQERFRRICDRQISARDPQKKQSKQQHGIAQRHRRTRQRFSFGQLWSEIPHKWRGILYGGLIGIILVLPLLTDSAWTTAISVIAFLFLMIMGFLVGRGMDAQDSLKDLTR